MIWTTLQKFSKTGIRFISGIILARLLTPYDYGCIGMLTIFLVLAEQFIDGGFGSALIQKKRPTQTDYSTIFYFNMALAVVMYLALFFSAPAIARFYDIPLLCDVLRVQGIILFIYALNIIQRSMLKKQLKFKVIAVTRIITSVVALIVTIVMAYMGFGVWALVAQYLIGATIPMVAFWIYTKWSPSWSFSWQSFKELFGFGFFMFLTHLLNRFATQFQGLLIGRFYDPVTLGFYSKAHSTERLASHTISGVMTSVTYPLYAEVQDDLPRMRNMIKRLTSTIAYITFPLLAILLLTAKPIFVLLYSERWLNSIPYFQVLCLAGMGICLSGVNTQPIAAIGKSKLMFTWTIIKRVIGIVVMVVGLLLFGMYGLLFGLVFNTWFAYGVNIGLVSKYIGYKWTRQVIDLLPTAVTTLVTGLASYLAVNYLGLSLYADGALKAALFVVLYMGWSHLFKPESYIYAKGILTPMAEKFKKKIEIPDGAKKVLGYAVLVLLLVGGGLGVYSLFQNKDSVPSTTIAASSEKKDKNKSESKHQDTKVVQSSNNKDSLETSVVRPTGTLEQKAKQVIRGDFGNGQVRKDRLGIEYDEIQGKVNEMYRNRQAYFNSKGGYKKRRR